jgi:GntR family transcriptional regulator
MTADYQRIVDEIEQQIRSGQLKPGDQLPSIRLLAADYDTSQTTVKYALGLLRDRGLIYGRQGKANYVAPRKTWRRRTR